MTKFARVCEANPLERSKTFVVSMRIDVRTFAEVVHLLKQQGVSAQTMSEVGNVVFEAVAKQNREKIFDSTEDAITYLAENRFSLAQLRQDDPRGGRMALQLQMEATHPQTAITRLFGDEITAEELAYAKANRERISKELEKAELDSDPV